MSSQPKPPWMRLYVSALLWFMLLLLAFVLPVTLRWQEVIGCGVIFVWVIIFVRWLYVHRAALAREEQEMRRRQSASSQRDTPLSPVQAQYLRVMERYARKKH